MTLDCQKVRERLDDFVDEILPYGEHRAVEEHLTGCESCRNELAELEQLLARARSLQRTITPERDLWPGIEARLTPRRPRMIERLAGLMPDWSAAFGPQALAGAAAALVIVALGALLWRSEPAATPAVPASAELSSETMAHRAEIARSEDGVLLARKNLVEAVEGPKDHLTPETVAVIEENMRIIDEAIGEIRSALEDDPFNHQLNMLLAAQYQQEAELLKRVSGV